MSVCWLCGRRRRRSPDHKRSTLTTTAALGDEDTNGQKGLNLIWATVESKWLALFSPSAFEVRAFDTHS